MDDPAKKVFCSLSVFAFRTAFDPHHCSDATAASSHLPWDGRGRADSVARPSTQPFFTAPALTAAGGEVCVLPAMVRRWREDGEYSLEGQQTKVVVSRLVKNGGRADAAS